MRVSTLALGLISVVSAAVIEERTYPVVPGSGFSTGEPIDGNGKGGWMDMDFEGKSFGGRLGATPEIFRASPAAFYIYLSSQLSTICQCILLTLRSG